MVISEIRCILIWGGKEATDILTGKDSLFF